MNQILKDNYNRSFSYLRLSLTSACNFRCNYCLPNGYNKREDKTQNLNIEEITNLVTAFAKLGTKKIRLTGGEPTIRKDFVDIIKSIKNVEGVEKIALTTNAYKLEENAKLYKQSGITALNISLDSLNPETFKNIRGQDKLAKILKGVDTALDAGFDNIKLNVVLLNNVNSQELDNFINYVQNKNVSLRFIELMQTIDNYDYFKKYHLSGKVIEDKLLAKNFIKEEKKSLTDGPAVYFSHKDSKGKIGLIMPYSKDFCKTCNRLRVSSDGQLFLCLFDSKGYCIRNFLQENTKTEELIEKITSLMPYKRETHFLHDEDPGLRKHLASIGG